MLDVARALCSLEMRVNILASVCSSLKREVSGFLSWTRVNSIGMECGAGSHQKGFGIPEWWVYCSKSQLRKGTKSGHGNREGLKVRSDMSLHGIQGSRKGEESGPQLSLQQPCEVDTNSQICRVGIISKTSPKVAEVVQK